MEKKKSNTTYGECRCCLAKGYHRDLMKEHYFNGIREVYFDIFMESFNLYLSTNALLTTLICSTCVQRLRDATSFRMMVVSTERQLLQAIAGDNKDTVFVNVNVVEENMLENQIDVKVESQSEVKVEIDEDVDADYESDYVPDDYVSDGTSDDLVDGEAALLGRFARVKLPPLPTRQRLPEICPEFCRQLDLIQDIKVLPRTILKLIEEQDSRRLPSNPRRVIISEKLAHIVNAGTILECSNWDHSEDSMEQDQICAQCIFRLRDARDFKKVVLSSQDELQLHEPDNDIIIDIKEEGLEEDILEDNKPESDVDDDDPEFIIDTGDTVDSVKDETDYEDIEFLEDEDMPEALDSVNIDSSQQIDQPKQVRIRRRPRRLEPDDDDDGPKGKWPKKLPKSERRKTYRQYSEDDLRKCLEEVRKSVLTPAEASAKYNVPQKTICAKIRAKPDDVLIDNITNTNNGKNLSKRPRASEIKTKVTETEDNNSGDAKTNDAKEAANPDDQRFMYKHKTNIKTILQYTNATLIKAYARDGFSCNFCQFQAKDPFELKQHNLKNHTNDKDTDEAIKVAYVTDLILKLDTTCFICKICKHPLNTVEDCDEVDPNREKMIQLIKEIKTILTFTNATPFKSKIIRYYCAYCSTDGPHFEDPDDLRTHTRTEHVGHRTEKIEYAMRPYWMNEVIKLDIDNLLCTVCCVVINNWNEMFKHLKDKHNIVLDQAYTRVIPYVLRSNLQCALCKESFSNYLHLDGHMNAHYNNYICNDCGETFLNHARLKQHALKHNTGKFKCSFCDKVFTLQKYRRKHEEMIHEQRTKFKCQYCPERFAGEYLRHLHCLEAHPDTVKTITCEFCGDVFTWKQYYTTHIRKKHQKRKPYECGKCNKKFFTNSELKEHMLRHAGAKNFECPVCHKRYVSMNSLKQHTKWHKKKNEA
ncbi:hypothetical protein PYW07_013288 [Mythimna separata]|uniref:Uncharacterized protein n=1 Tax=Mythimna separata TaxID=271217 RepID=A0AAD7Y6A5_MYTSE|nr:hypothetical protein PYW07_013288 [Mythimna separata]